ncbi:NAD(+)/NADH kinase [Senegalia massiliensis]|uniref:NAD kinase n=1 Tax=Senegalia massiliensis TaxID=1720316 RepID=A0A845QSM7_9CLOT|nr:NAD(+)/NADH kinase [Senegalia massiliensis]NBI05817.1 NAD(+)/NADH kinase [Senegalia massiliensis]
MNNSTYKNKKINVIYNKDEESSNTAALLKQKLNIRGYTVTKNYDTEAILNICVGGDGSFLTAVHHYGFPDIPFVGINTGHLGFFQEISPTNLEEFLDKLDSNDYIVDSLYLVEALVCTRTSCIDLIGINEIVVKGIESKVIHLNISIDNTYLERFSGDGVIISTPMGSSAYNFSSGGSIVYTTLDVLQLTPLAPINSKVYRSLTTSAIVPSDMEIKIAPEYRDENSILITVDGNQHKYENITEISFKLSKMTINLLNMGKKDFWSNVRDKFL